MGMPQLRIYYGPEEYSAAALQSSPAAPERVTLPLGDVFPLLAEALQTGKTWVQDFAQEEITVSTDLYEVLLAYQHYRRPSA